jgi:hypothetical protein
MSTLTRRRPMRNEQLVSLRSAMPVQLVTLHHDIPTWTTVAIEPPAQEGDDDTTTPKVPAGKDGRRETAARKGGRAR